ncbi:MAG: hypothetical protein JXQ90_05670 [Cyclobacteriaceae bacterium]
MSSNEELNSVNHDLQLQKEVLSNKIHEIELMQDQLIQSEKMASLGT